MICTVAFLECHWKLSHCQSRLVRSSGPSEQSVRHPAESDVLRVQDEVGSDDEIGRAVVRLANLRVNEVADMWVPVKPLMEHEGVSLSPSHLCTAG